MKKICYILLLAIMLGPIAALTGCKKEDKIKWDMINFKYFSLNIPGFDYLKIEDKPESEDENSYSPGMQLEVRYRYEYSNGYKPVKFVVADNLGGTLTAPNGKRLKMGDSLTQGNFPVMIDKFCLCWDLSFISFIKDYDNYGRPNNNSVEWIKGIEKGSEGREYDLVGYVSNENRASFAIDNYTGKMYYIEPGNTIDISNEGFLECLLRFTPEYTAHIVPETQKVNYKSGMLRDRYGQIIASSDNNGIDYENKVLYYTALYTNRTVYTITEDRAIIFINTIEVNNELAIEGIYEIGDNFTFTPVSRDYVLDKRVSSIIKGTGSGMAFMYNKIENGYLYLYNYSRKEMSRYGFLEDKSVETIAFENLYSYTFESDIRNGIMIESGSYAVSLWDYDTVLVLRYNYESQTVDWYYANVFEENEFDGTLETFGKLHPLLLGCDPEVNHPTYNDSLLDNYLPDSNKKYARLNKNGVTYKLVDDEETHSVVAVPVE